MMWLFSLLVVILVLPWVIRRRRELVTVFPWEPISTLHTEMSKRRSKDKKRALDAATQLLD